MFYYIEILKLAIKIQLFYTLKYTTFLGSEFHLLLNYITSRYLFPTFAAITAAVQLSKQRFLYLWIEASGGFGNIANFLTVHNFLILCDLVLFFQSKNMWASISLLISRNVPTFTYGERRSSRKLLQSHCQHNFSFCFYF